MRPPTRLLAVALLLLVAAPVPAAPIAARPPAPPVLAYLEAELAAARSGELYLVLAPAPARLELRAQGTALHRFALGEAALGRPRGAGGGAAWPAVELRLPAVPPPPARRHLVPAAGGSAAQELAQPPGVDALDFRARQREETLLRAPASWRLPLDPPLELEVRGDGEPLPAPGPDALAGTAALFGRRLGGAAVPARLRLEMPAAEARRLYLALQPGMRLLIDPRPPAP